MGTRSVTVRLDEGLVGWADAEAERRGVKRTRVLEDGLRVLRGDAGGSPGLGEAPGDDTRVGSSAGRRSATRTRDEASATGSASARGASRPSASPRAPVPDVPGVVRGSEVKRGYRDPMAGRPLRSSFSDHDQWLLALQRWRKASDAS